MTDYTRCDRCRDSEGWLFRPIWRNGNVDQEFYRCKHEPEPTDGKQRASGDE